MIPMEPAIIYTFPKTKKYSELRPSDVPRGLSPDDVAKDEEE